MILYLCLECVLIEERSVRLERSQVPAGNGKNGGIGTGRNIGKTGFIDGRFPQYLSLRRDGGNVTGILGSIFFLLRLCGFIGYEYCPVG